MSKFYNEISKYYNEIFPVGDYQIQFLKESIKSDRVNILDIACGNGGYSKVFANLNHNVTAIDLNESMINLVKKNYKDIDARVLNMLDIDKIDKKFDLIYCIGNSLVHLENDEEILEFLIKSSNLLNDNGKLVLQIINYNRILDKDIKKLPIIEGDNLKFYRFYENIEDKNKISFNTRLEVNNNIYENSEMLYPIRSENLIKLLEKAGFSDIKIFGSFKKEEYEKDNSYALVIKASI